MVQSWERWLNQNHPARSSAPPQRPKRPPPQCADRLRRRPMSLMGIAKFERFFRLSAGLDIDKADLKRYSDFVNGKIYDLLLRGQAAAKANNHVTIEPFDLPITKGLQE